MSLKCTYQFSTDLPSIASPPAQEVPVVDIGGLTNVSEGRDGFTDLHLDIYFLKKYIIIN